MKLYWEEFKVAPVQRVLSDDYVSLNVQGMLLVGKSVYEKLGSPEAGVLLYDKVNAFIGVRPASSRTRNAYRFARKKGGTYRFLRIRPFCDHFRIGVERTISFIEPRKTGEDGK